MSAAAADALARMSVEAGQRVRAERRRRRWTMRKLADLAGVALAVVHRVEAGHVATLETYARLATALGLRPDLLLSDPRARAANRQGGEDIVHVAMGELEARLLAAPGRTIAIDEPYQHYQFAGRADVLVVDREERNLFHIENRTQFPNLQDAAGSWNAKRQYLAREMAERYGIGPNGWRSITHTMACLWSAEVLHTIRLRRATFDALAPDGPKAFEAWLGGTEPDPGTTSILILLDPLVATGERRRVWAPSHEPPRLDPRYRDYADAAEALRRLQ